MNLALNEDEEKYSFTWTDKDGRYEFPRVPHLSDRELKVTVVWLDEKPASRLRGYAYVTPKYRKGAGTRRSSSGNR